MTPGKTIDYENLSKLDKLAYLFVALGPEESAPLLKYLEDGLVEQICKRMATIHVLPNEIKRKIINEFSLLLVNKIPDTLNNEEQVKKLLTLAQGEDKAKLTWSNALQDPICAQMSKMFEQLEPVKIFDAIKNEQVQTIAFIFTCVPSKRATQLLAFFEKEKQEAILLALGTMQPIPVTRMAEILRSFTGLIDKKPTQVEQQPTQSLIDGGPAFVANLLNSLKKEDKTKLLENLGQKDTELAKSIQKYLFTFEDLLTLKKEDLQKIVREVDTNDLIIALKGAEKELIAAILQAMSRRAAESLKEELESLGPVKIKDVETARDKIVATVRQLETNGQIILGKDEDELMLP